MTKILKNISKIIVVLIVVFGLFYLMQFCEIQSFTDDIDCDELNLHTDCLTLQYNTLYCQNAEKYFYEKNCGIQNITIHPPKIEKFK